MAIEVDLKCSLFLVTSWLLPWHTHTASPIRAMAQPRAMRAVTGVVLLPYRVAYAPRPVSWRSPLGALSANLCAPRGPGGVHQPGPGVRVVSQCSGDIISWPISTGVGLELKPCGEYQAVKALTGIQCRAPVQRWQSAVRASSRAARAPQMDKCRRISVPPSAAPSIAMRAGWIRLAPASCKCQLGTQEGDFLSGALESRVHLLGLFFAEFITATPSGDR